MGAVYKITNRVNGKIYVGKTMGSPAYRWRSHKGEANRGNNSYLYRAMRKYGIENFAMEVIDHALLQEELDAKEIMWIAQLDTTSDKKGYNCTIGGEGRVHTASSRARLRGVRKMSPESIEKRRAKMIGRKLSPEHIEKLAASLRGKTQPREIVEKRRAAQKARFKEKPWFIPKPSADGLKRIGQASRERMRTPEMRAEKSAMLKKLRAERHWSPNFSEEVKAGIAQKMREIWAERRANGTLSERTKHLRGARKSLTEDQKQTLRDNRKAWWEQHPEARVEASRKAKADYENRRAAELEAA